MNDSTLEIISIVSIIAGLILGFILIFDYTPADSFFLEEDDDNAFVEGIILKKSFNYKKNYSSLKIYGCKSFDAYSEKNISKKINESIKIYGSFSDKLFIVEKYE